MKKEINKKEEKKKEIKKTKLSKNEGHASFNLIEVIAIIIMTGLIVGVSTGAIIYKSYDASPALSGSLNPLKEVEKAYENIINSYVEEVDQSELVNAAIEGMYDYLEDPYTTYIDETTEEDLMDRLNGEYTGIGVEITKIEEGILIVNVFEDGPAHKAGILSGDIIVKIDGKDVTNLSASEVSTKIKNSKSNMIEISVLRSGITISKSITIRNVNVPSVTKEKFDSTGYIKIDTFSNTTYSQFKTALENLEKENITSLIIDVRDNGGGYLNSASDIAKLFIEKGKKIYGLEDKTSKTFYEDDTKEKRNYKITVLINSSSASASEVLASALKESYGAILVGTTSYGKGTVQETSKLSSGGMLKYTTAYWLTPSGKCINEVGITPDIEEVLEPAETITYENDTQLKAALNALK